MFSMFFSTLHTPASDMFCICLLLVGRGGPCPISWIALYDSQNQLSAGQGEHQEEKPIDIYWVCRNHMESNKVTTISQLPNKELLCMDMGYFLALSSASSDPSCFSMSDVQVALAEGVLGRSAGKTFTTTFHDCAYILPVRFITSGRTCKSASNHVSSVCCEMILWSSR